MNWNKALLAMMNKNKITCPFWKGDMSEICYLYSDQGMLMYHNGVLDQEELVELSTLYIYISKNDWEILDE